MQVDRARARTRIRAEHPVRDEHPLSWLRLEEMPAGKLTRGQWTKEQAFIVRLGASSISFLSAQPDSNIVGATASLLLEADEAQDIDPRKWDRDLVPMGSSGAGAGQRGGRGSGRGSPRDPRGERELGKRGGAAAGAVYAGGGGAVRAAGEPGAPVVRAGDGGARPVECPGAVRAGRVGGGAAGGERSFGKLTMSGPAAGFEQG